MQGTGSIFFVKSAKKSPPSTVFSARCDFLTKPTDKKQEDILFTCKIHVTILETKCVIIIHAGKFRNTVYFHGYQVRSERAIRHFQIIAQFTYMCDGSAEDSLFACDSRNLSAENGKYHSVYISRINKRHVP